MKTPALRPRSAFSLIELLVVIAIILILLGLIVPLSRLAKEKSNLMTCGQNMKTIDAGLLMQPASNDGYLPWAGNADRNWYNDWMWGGQNDQWPAIESPSRFTASDYGFHPEGGSVYTTITGIPRMFTTDANKPDVQITSPRGGKPNTAYTTMEHKTYRCPSTGEIGKAQRNNFSMNDAYDTPWGDSTDDAGESATKWEDMKERAQRSKYGVRLSTLKGPSHKIMLINEDPRTMKNASFYPGGSATGKEIKVGVPHITHDGKINMGFADGHIGQVTSEFVLESQRTNIMSSDGKLNNVQYWYAPAD